MPEIRCFKRKNARNLCVACSALWSMSRFCNSGFIKSKMDATCAWDSGVGGSKTICMWVSKKRRSLRRMCLCILLLLNSKHKQNNADNMPANEKRDTIHRHSWCMRQMNGTTPIKRANLKHDVAESVFSKI